MLWIPVVGLGALGFILGLGLALIHRFFGVRLDPREEQIIKVLPGINCGACGYAGCAGYAHAVVQEGGEITRCTVGGQPVAEKIGRIMGQIPVVMEKRVARVFCRGGRDKCAEKFIYRGIISCRAVHLVAGGNKECSYGCLGMGSCAEACPFGAIEMREDRLPEVLEEKCTACGLCVLTCPRNLLELVPVSKRVVIGCRSQDRGAVTRKICQVGCITCFRCERACPTKAISVKNNLAGIDYRVCTNQRACVRVCPQHTIRDFPPV